MRCRIRTTCACVLCALAASAQGQTSAAPSKSTALAPREIKAPPLTLAYVQEKPTGSKPAPASPEGRSEKAEAEDELQPFGFREVSDFFNVREANSNLRRGRWEFETPLGWVTRKEHDDDVTWKASLKYGITDDLYAELGLLPINLGDGGDQGNGDLSLTLFWQFLHETEMTPAAATWAEMRIPSGQGSSGVDAELHFNVTKTLLPKFRGHLEGFIETANGERGESEGGEGGGNKFFLTSFGGGESGERRPFQWGVGPGFDYQFSDEWIGVLNYVNRCSEEEGGHNQNILQLGFDHRIAEHQHLKFAVNVGLDGSETTPNLGAKIQWSIEW